jgi:hypothetical protein
MTEQTSSGGRDANSVRKAVTVQAPPTIAWRVFTESMGTWWPLANYKIGKARAVDAVIEPRVGGRWYERGGHCRGRTTGLARGADRHGRRSILLRRRAYRG